MLGKLPGQPRRRGQAATVIARFVRMRNRGRASSPESWDLVHWTALHDKTRPSGTAPIPQDEVQAVVEKTLAGEPPDTVTQWTGRAMAVACGLSLTTAQRIWRSHRLQPHRMRTFKRSTNPQLATKLDDIVGLYISPPRHAVALSVDETAAVERTKPNQGPRPHATGTLAQARQVRTFTHDDVRNGTKTLFAALNTLEGTVLGRHSPRHRHGDLITFLNHIEDNIPAGKVIHAIMDK